MTMFIEVETHRGVRCINLDRIESFSAHRYDDDKTELIMLDEQGEEPIININIAYNDFKLMLNRIGVSAS